MVTVNDIRQALKGRKGTERVLLKIGPNLYTTLTGIHQAPVVEAEGSGYFKGVIHDDLLQQEATVVTGPNETPE